jgi:hypothetical protein
MTRRIQLSPHSVKMFYISLPVLFIITIGLCFVLLPDPYQSGISGMKEKNWTKAIAQFSKVDSRSPYFHQACEALRVSKAHLFYDQGQWSEALELARQPADFLALAEDFSALRDSCQYHIDWERAPILISRLKETVTEGSNHATLRELLTQLGSGKAFSDYLGTNCSNGHIILEYSTRLLHASISQNADYQALLSNEGKLASESAQLKATLATIRSGGIRWRSFIIDKMFDTRSSDTDEDGTEEVKGVYSGISTSEASEIVLIASDREIPTSIYARMNVTVLVKPLGRKGYIKGNGYGYTTSVYVPTYETVSKDMDPNLLARKIGSVEKERSARSLRINALRKKLEEEPSAILTAAMGDLKASFWQ